MAFHSEFETEGKLKKKLKQAGFIHVKTHGAMAAFLVVLYRINLKLGVLSAKLIKPIDLFISDIPVLRNCANYLIGVAEKK